MKEILRFIVGFLLDNQDTTRSELLDAAVAAGHARPAVVEACDELLVTFINLGVLDVGSNFSALIQWRRRVERLRAARVLEAAVDAILTDPVRVDAEEQAQIDTLTAAIEGRNAPVRLVQPEIDRLAALASPTAFEVAMLTVLRLGRKYVQMTNASLVRHREELLVRTGQEENTPRVRQ